ncbi:hypothetical protein FPANT_12654 [Fusarium pseudoanthophilum]|uniref:Uncharacterized protein n=1 Tax=Fusarium pseudoanthophilum TaxID=48495 RepID=A0A8H5NPB6_9HYPO|nr:hypothetical protein FPANT_12654 [Fusarium pseudoanthophilum]
MKVFLPIMALARRTAKQKSWQSQEDLEKLKGARPGFVSNMRTNWDRIARAATNMFGFGPNKDGHDPNEEHYSNVRYVCDRMVKTLHNDEMIPASGYGGLKPLLLCDESKFAWSRPKEMADNKAGAWVYKKRNLVNSIKQASTSLCRPGVFAITLTRNDFIIFCPPPFKDEVANTKSAVDAKDSVQKDDMLDTYSATSLSRVMVHDLAHWFGGDKTGRPENRSIPDQQAVGKEGALVWQKPDGKRTTDASLADLKKYLTCTGITGNDGKAKPSVDEMIPYERLPNSKKVRLG